MYKCPAVIDPRKLTMPRLFYNYKSEKIRTKNITLLYVKNNAIKGN